MIPCPACSTPVTPDDRSCPQCGCPVPIAVNSREGWRDQDDEEAPDLDAVAALIFRMPPPDLSQESTISTIRYYDLAFGSPPCEVVWEFPRFGFLRWWGLTGPRGCTARVRMRTAACVLLVDTPRLPLPLSFTQEPCLLQTNLPISLDIETDAMPLRVITLISEVPIDYRLWPWPGGKK